MLLLRPRSVVRILAVWSIAILCCGVVSAGTAELQELERETRVFRISVDGTERGQCTMRIQRRNDGTDWVGGNADLLFNFIVYKYRFSSGGAAIWRDGRLVEMDRTANFNGTRYHVTAVTTPEGLVVDVNGRSSLNSRDLWSTTCWQLPKHLASDPVAGGRLAPDGTRRADASNTARTVLILDADKGQRVMGQLRYVGDETLEVTGEQKLCRHYRITGDVDVHVWYDSDLRLVRRQSVESGHKVLMEIMRISAE